MTIIARRTAERRASVVMTLLVLHQHPRRFLNLLFTRQKTPLSEVAIRHRVSSDPMTRTGASGIRTLLPE